jgi:DNA-3-methyladenine glycosylase II
MDPASSRWPRTRRPITVTQPQIRTRHRRGPLGVSNPAGFDGTGDLNAYFCQAHGEQVGLPNGTTYALFPAPEIVLGLSDNQFSSIGMAFKRRPLKAAAEAYLEHGAKWRELAPDTLIAELQIVPRIGPWTAHAAVADWSNDWSLYPYADLAVRTWAKRAAPSRDWPADEPAFGQAWRALAGEHLCSLTLLTLAWGSQHGDIG